MYSAKRTPQLSGSLTKVYENRVSILAGSVCRRRQRCISCARNYIGASRLRLGLPREYGVWRVVRFRSARLGFGRRSQNIGCAIWISP